MMKTLLGICSLSLFLLSGTSGVHAQKLEVIDGYPLTNFSLTVNASANGDFFGHLFQNPGALGEWLLDRGSMMCYVGKGSARYPFSSFAEKTVNRIFPVVRNCYSGSPLTSTRIRVQTFCPLGVNDAGTSSLPVLLVEINCHNSGTEAEAFDLVLSPDSLKGARPCKSLRYSGAGNGTMQLTVDRDRSEWNGTELIVPIVVRAGETEDIRFQLAFYDGEWVTANRFADTDALTAYVYRNWADLKLRTELFDRAIPRTGDRELDTYLRWYMVPGISLTKCTLNDEVLTMGYCELNQRDSYWTSWLHLVLFKDLEKKMIEESIAAQQPSGKIPTTILPLIEREDDLDINAFFILRAVRFYRLYHNGKELRDWWPSLKKAMDWLVSRDTNGNGLPVQVSFWGDWKDVTGVDGRIYSPFSGMIYLAALKEMQSLAGACGDDAAADGYGATYRKGYEFINRPIGQGGLWNGHYYCQRWKDGTVNDRILQDQTIGILFGVVPADRAEAIIHTLNEKNLTEYGVCETYPYYPVEFGYAPGTYHNGGVWPWLSFMDDWARIRMGREKEAVDLIKRVANADLVVSGDWSPNEYINSLTGRNQGYQLQGWNAGLFGLVYFGLLNKNIIP
jgi:hypothetical protein